MSGEDAILRMYEGAVRSVAARAAYARELYVSQGLTEEQWRALPFEEREAVIRKARRAREMAELSASRKRDRAVMALQVTRLAVEYGLDAVYRAEQPGTRKTSVDLAGPHGLKVTVKFDGGAPSPDVYVLRWHGVDEGVRINPRAFAGVNTYHGHKATDAARGFAQLLSTLRQRFEAIADGSAFAIGAYRA